MSEMKNNSDDRIMSISRALYPDITGWVFLTEKELEVYEQIREIREIVMESEEPQYLITSST